MQFFGFCVSKRMKMIPEKKLAYILVKQEDLYHYNIQTGGTEGLVNEPMKMSNVDISVLFKEDTGKIKLSFRSKKDIDISKFANQYFKGGGHKNAAGGVSYKSLQETEADFLNFT
jgi:phosphoesterase RecJ-like protein